MNGIIPLNKPRGLTSFDCVAKLRHTLHTKKIGHSGTLDPNVDGVLPICVGQATKVVPYLMSSGKVYRGQVTLGFATTTEDLDGEVIATTRLKNPVTPDAITAAMQQLTGTITQTPPMYSAVKVNGRKLYEYARTGETVDRPSRQVTVERFSLTGSTTFDAATGTQIFPFEVACSKGTYVRTLAVDLGRQLGVDAVMSRLTRWESGGFTLDQAVTLAEIDEAVINGTIDELLRPLDYALQEFPHVVLTDRLWELVKHGGFLTTDQVGLSADIVALQHAGETKCLYQWSASQDKFKPLKMFSVD